MIADALGVTGSVVCLIHCVGLPLLLLAGLAVPTFGLDDEQFHKLILFFVVPVAIVAFGMGWLRHHDRHVLLLGALGITGLVLAALVLHDIIGESGERIVTVIAAALMIGAHVRNYRLTRAAC